MLDFSPQKLLNHFIPNISRNTLIAATLIILMQQSMTTCYINEVFADKQTSLCFG